MVFRLAPPAGRRVATDREIVASNGVVERLLVASMAVVLVGCGGNADRGAPAGAPDGGAVEASTVRKALPAAALEYAAEGWKTDFSRHSVPFDEFQSGGPPKDGIPAIDAPAFVGVARADEWLEPAEPVIALSVADETRAYPIQILIWHEIVNDEIGGVPVAVTFCPLCNTAIVFDRRAGGRTLDFGTTGKLRNSDLVMYDRQTESWWQQFGGTALVGLSTGTELRRLPAQIISWAQFKREYGSGRVLSRDTGHGRPYGENPYRGYDDAASPPFFPVEHADDDRLPPKERVVFVDRDGEAVAVPFSVLARRHVMRVVVGEHRLLVRWRPDVASALDSERIAEGRAVGAAEVRENGNLVPFEEPFWFAVAAFRPEVRVVR
jgi:hypothetical protein